MRSSSSTLPLSASFPLQGKCRQESLLLNPFRQPDYVAQERGGIRRAVSLHLRLARRLVRPEGIERQLPTPLSPATV